MEKKGIFEKLTTLDEKNQCKFKPLQKMGIFDNKEINKKINSIEKILIKLVDDKKQDNLTINQLKADLIEANKRSPEYEKIAKEASRKTSEYRNRASETLEEAKDYVDKSIVVYEEIKSTKLNLDAITSEIENAFKNFKIENEDITTLTENLQSKIENINSNIVLFEETIEDHPDFESEILELETSINKIKENESKSSQLIKSINNRRIELDTLYNEILGYEEEDEEGKIIGVVGLKQQLQESLNGLEERTKSYKTQFDKLETSTNENSTNLLNVNSEKITKQIKDWEEKYLSLNKEIRALLPNAVTAGLSHAFSKKKDDEDKLYDRHKKQFSYGIIGMVSVSLIPFIISIITIFGNDSLNIIIERAPKLVIAILPLYIPVLWLSISSSKKMNLSKRLIEEYTHKEVLSKTFEGLSKQIHDLEEDNISKELKIKLLQDFLQMYSENPGKLISDYNNSDHPIMELLENSNKLDKAISKLEKYPGMNKVTDFLSRKSNKKLEQVSDSVERGIDRMVGLNNDNDNSDGSNEDEVQNV